jgi:hypothetical protein
MRGAAAERENTEQSRVMGLLSDIDGLRSAYEKQNDPRNLGQLKGLALEVKSAVFLPHGIDPNAVAVIFRASGVDVEMYGNLIVNRALVEARVKDEPDIAERVGWNQFTSFEENIESANPRATSPNLADQLLMGFILGYPESALETFTRQQQDRSFAKTVETVDILSPAKEKVYTFQVGTEYGGKNAPDVKALQKQVTAVFEAHS